ncbi:c-type cytochrome [Aurantimonas sp. Leaf443]|uniref:c-type cytochrome n=1 Tax=Aurantimonas sp. Leaf443 TaxID=1736378 RepID=UPI0006FC1A4F|nr:c-type cytochrome [Aurantimonas sp. Leaf443]KQT85475.1 cytochrome C [Aurantimonas sp. Leaf443]
MRYDLKITGKRLAIAAALAVAAPFAVSYSGLVSIAANTGHYAPVEWFLHWTMQNSVARQSLGIAVPEEIDLADNALVRRGAGHFATGCAPCHGGPGDAQSPVVLSMMPWPPRLETKVGEWKDRELFWIGQHGIKYSGMPSWTTQNREDEVWAMVAFLRALPQMTPETYADLALGGGPNEALVPNAGAPAAGVAPGADGAVPAAPVASGAPAMPSDPTTRIALADCARCHGFDGRGRGGDGAFPVIAGQTPAYLLASLKAYAQDTRHSGYMEPAAARYDETVLAALADWYGAQPVEASAGAVTLDDGLASTTPLPAADGIPAQIMPAASLSENALPEALGEDGGRTQGEERLALGELIATRGLAARKIPACISCHGESGRARNAMTPYLGGQPEWYLRTHLELFKEELRGGTGAAHLMTEFMPNMTEEQIEAVSAWYAEQPLGR